MERLHAERRPSGRRIARCVAHRRAWADDPRRCANVLSTAIRARSRPAASGPAGADLSGARAGRRVHVYVDETGRVAGLPLTRGIAASGIPCTLITDGAAAALMRQAKVDLISSARTASAPTVISQQDRTYGWRARAPSRRPVLLRRALDHARCIVGRRDLIPIEQRPRRSHGPGGRPSRRMAWRCSTRRSTSHPRYVTGFIMDVASCNHRSRPDARRTKRRHDGRHPRFERGGILRA